MIASNTALNLNLVWESHHAMGVPIKINIEVLTMASLIVTMIADKSNSFNIMVSHIQISKLYLRPYQFEQTP